MTSNLWTVVILAGALTLFSPFIWRRLLTHAGVLDVPNHRSSHSMPTLRGGGIAPLVSMFSGGLIVAVLISDETRWHVVSVIIAASFVAILGLVEDIWGLPVKIRAGFQLLTGLIFAVSMSWLTESNWVWIPLAAIFFTANVNFTNFMDGINGISSLHGFVVGLAFAWIGHFEGQLWLTTLGLLNAAAFVTFLPWNLLPPGMFLGDVGSYLLGGMNAAMSIAALLVGVNPIMALAPLCIYWTDTISTLIRRLLRKDPIFKAHREHIYQQLTEHRLSHTSVALIVATFSALACLAGLATTIREPYTLAVALLALATLVFVYLALPSLAARRKVSTS